jgi:dTDP-glucose 4,6-dehydratase
MNILITGGCGFIGINFVIELLKNPKNKVTIIDKISYLSVANHFFLKKNFDSRIKIYKNSINEKKKCESILKYTSPELVVNFAAETHVDRSIFNPEIFFENNVIGTLRLIENCKNYIEKYKVKKFKFIHISTDEVYGSLKLNEPAFTERNNFKPNSPYAASKASSDHIIRSFYKTFNFPGIITNCSNNYGPFQFPEKLIPVIIFNALNSKEIPIYGDGKQIRDWIYVSDHCEAIKKVAMYGEIGESYNIGGNNEISNNKIADKICEHLDKLKKNDAETFKKLIKKVKDRPGHDRRYAINNAKIKKLGWKPKITLEHGLELTINWYLKNKWWLKKTSSKNLDKWIKENYHQRNQKF